MERPSSSNWRPFVSRPSEAPELRTAPRVPARGVFVHCEFDQRSRPHIPDMMRIAITPAAFEAVVATLVLGTVAVEPERDEDGDIYIWLDPRVLTKLKALRGPGESYSDVILRVAKGEGGNPMTPH